MESDTGSQFIVSTRPGGEGGGGGLFKCVPHWAFRHQHRRPYFQTITKTVWKVFLHHFYIIFFYTALFYKHFFILATDKKSGLGIRSFCSNQMSDCEQFTQIVQDKWVTVSESLRSLKGNERCERIAQVAQRKWAMWVNRSFRSPKMSEWAIRSKKFS